MRISFYDYCMKYGLQGLLQQWHPIKNAPLTPEGISYGSRRSVWWKCEQGHEWQALVKSRAIGGTGCPVCANRRLSPGENDLAATHPELARQWHPEKNGSLTPYDLVAGSHRKVWWICDRGHVWQAAVASRAGGTGCPVCAGKAVIPGENDLASLFPAISAQWHPTLNGALTPEQVTAGSHKKVWWICPNGHIWKAVIYSRAGPGSRKCGCPVCAGRTRPARMERYRLAMAGHEKSPRAGAPEQNRKKLEVFST